MQFRQLGPGLVQQVQSLCNKCEGQGTVIADKDKCKTCVGKKIVAESKEVIVEIDKGMSHGSRITLRGMGDSEVMINPYSKYYLLLSK